MVQLKIRIALWIYSLSLVLMGLCTTDAFASKKITKITVQGNKRIERNAIIEKLSQKEGQEIQVGKIREDIQSIFSLGVFDQIEIHENDLGPVVELIVIVKERPVIGNVKFEGLDKLDKDDFKDANVAKKYTVYNPSTVNESALKMREVYESKGFYLADIKVKTEPIPNSDNEVELIYDIRENDKIRIKKISFLGNKVFSDSDLKAIMQTREGGTLSWLTDSGSFKEVDLERDVQRLSYWYYNHGYVQVQMSKPQVYVSPDKKWVYITFHMAEGEQFRIGEIKFGGELLFPEDELRGELKLKSGDIFSSDALREQVLTYTAKYGDLGYAFANVVPQHGVRAEEKLIDITFEVEKGEKVYIGQISMVGNSKTRDKVIRRELKFYEGELYNETKLRRSQENVERLGFFEKGVAFNKSVRPGTKDVLDIVIVVKERNTGTLTVGAGYSSADGFIANAQISQENFLGYGHRMAFFGIYSKSASRFNLSYDDPYFWDTLWSLGGDLYRADRTVPTSFGVTSYSELKLGGDVRLGHPLSDYIRVFGTYKIEDVELKDVFNETILNPAENEGITSSFTAQVVRDTRDNRFEPSRGAYQSGSVEIAGLGGDKFFTKFDLNYRYFRPLFWKFILRTNAEYGFVTPIGNKALPVSERFVLGGPYSLRGYQPLTVGSVVCAIPNASLLGTLGSASQGPCGDFGPGYYPWVLGGQHKVLATAEVEFPLFEQVGIKWAFFVDAGQAFDRIKQPSDRTNPKTPFIEGPGILSNWGFEIRWFSPIGPLRFIFGFPFVAQAGGNKDMVFSFTIGPSF